MSQINPDEDGREMTDEEYYGQVQDYGGEGPHIRLITSDDHLIRVPQKVLSEGS